LFSKNYGFQSYEIFAAYLASMSYLRQVMKDAGVTLSHTEGREEIEDI
jgi:hypothetical protein